MSRIGGILLVVPHLLDSRAVLHGPSCYHLLHAQVDKYFLITLVVGEKTEETSLHTHPC